MERASSVPLLARGCCGCVRVAGCGRASVRRFCAPTGSWLSINPAHTKLRRATRFARLIVLINVFLSKSLPNTETFDRRDEPKGACCHTSALPRITFPAPETYFLVAATTIASAARWTSGVSRSSPSDLAFAFSVFAAPGRAPSVAHLGDSRLNAKPS